MGIKPQKFVHCKIEPLQAPLLARNLKRSEQIFKDENKVYQKEAAKLKHSIR
jgi:hypothetical protein